MVLCQWEAARLLEEPLPVQVSLFTACGTMLMYGSDRFMERRHLQHLLARHDLGGWLDWLIFSSLLIGAAYGALSLNSHDRGWFLLLAVSGVIYLLVTVRLLVTFPSAKEILGSWCFTVLVWGHFTHPEPVWWLWFFAMGVANFLWAGWDDRQRDAANGLLSPAVRAPRLTVGVARCVAMAATLGFAVSLSPGHPFTLTALAHALRWWPARWSIDWAFLPLLLVL